jgi:hypothetical protein
MLQRSKMRLLVLLSVLLAALMPTRLAAQNDSSLHPSTDRNVDRKYDPSQAPNQATSQVSNQDPSVDSNDVPLGDVARSLRKKTSPSQDVIDDDNLTKVMEQAESRHALGSSLTFLMAGENKEFQVAAPDATCSLSFSANAKTLLSNAYAQMELPPGEVRKLEGPATIEGDALIVALQNRTDWHVSEVAVALTVVKKAEAHELSLSNDAPYNGGATLLPSVAGNVPQESEIRPEKKPDVTVIYRMRAAAPPLATTVFSAPLNLDLAPGEEWHWAIVQARGYPPQSYAGSAAQTAQQMNGPSSTQPPSNQPTLNLALRPSQNSVVSLPQNPSVESTSPENR